MTIRPWLGAALAAAVLAGGAPAGLRPAEAGAAADDDLAVVKRATADDEEEKAPPAPRLRRRPARDPRWLRVRVIEHRRRGAGVTINLPLGLARAIGDEIPIDLDCRRHRRGTRCETLRVGDVLRTLAAGEDLVLVEDEDTTVRVWVD